MAIPLMIRRDPVIAGAFARRVALAVAGPLKAISIRCVQLNVGLRCSLTCRNCHVESSPRRREEMSWETMQLALTAARKVRAATIDITGGEPELHPQFRKLVQAARKIDLQVIVRTNLTILLKPPYTQLPVFFKKHRVRLVASLPSYEEEVVDQQRGRGVYRDSIRAMKELNAIGYGIDPTLPLDLIHNPVGTALPRPQSTLERDYKRELDIRHGLRFTQLFTVTNMPVGRFQRALEQEGKAFGYAEKLQTGFNPDTLDGLMCRHQLHVSWDGTLHDCDFNCAMEIGVGKETPGNIRDFDPTTYLQRKINCADHCFGCTAWRGSSFGGALV
ncbi:MAG TPA: arsenosugar biosynthesis radical SAM (seleno)protein ArsS [Tepidisphaeraceae bacterium]|jgi:radical SAM/Cys-rich protein|nr:arsenosugar biosynthesis radical SAM (seleno)protein ArsS [Tepidisphaeraceae bacterium]